MKGELPPSWRPWVLWVAVGLSVAAAGINVPHVLAHLEQHGIEDGTRYFYAALPDLLLFFGIVLIKYLRRHPLGWVMLSLGVSWLVWAALSDVRAELSARLLALAPVLVAALMTVAVDLAKGEAKVDEALSTPDVTVPARVETRAVTSAPEAVVTVPAGPVTTAAEDPPKARRTKHDERFEAFAKAVEEHPDEGPKALHLRTGIALSTVERYLRKIRAAA